MHKRIKIIYWITTAWLSLGMLSTGIVQLIKTKEETNLMFHLGYPIYFLTLIGTWKILGVIAILVPGYRLVKEWAYAGFFFTATGAIFSHIVAGDPFKENFGPLLLVILTILSWHFRPPNRKLVISTTV